MDFEQLDLGCIPVCGSAPVDADLSLDSVFGIGEMVVLYPLARSFHGERRSVHAEVIEDRGAHLTVRACHPYCSEAREQLLSRGEVFEAPRRAVASVTLPD